MAVIQRMSSDLTGKEGDPSEFVTLVLRAGPGVDRALAFDVLPEEIQDIDPAKDIFTVEIRKPGEAQGEQIVCTLAELKSKIVPKGSTLEDLIESARSLRGRRPLGQRNGS